MDSDKLQKEQEERKNLAKLDKYFERERKFLLTKMKKDPRGFNFHLSSMETFFVYSDKVFSKETNLGEIYDLNFLLGYKGEMAYKHPGLVLGDFGEKVLVLPGTTYIDRKHSSFYHWENKKDGSKEKIILDIQDTGINKGVYDVSDIRLISKTRLVPFELKGQITDEDLLKEISTIAFEYLYNRENTPLDIYKENISEKNEKISQLEKAYKKLISKLKNLIYNSEKEF